MCCTAGSHNRDDDDESPSAESRAQSAKMHSALSALDMTYTLSRIFLKGNVVRTMQHCVCR